MIAKGVPLQFLPSIPCQPAVRLRGCHDSVRRQAKSRYGASLERHLVHHVHQRYVQASVVREQWQRHSHSIVATPATVLHALNSVGVRRLKNCSVTAVARHVNITSIMSSSLDSKQSASPPCSLTLDDASSSLSVAGTHIASQNTRIEQLCQASLKKVATIGLLESQGEAADERAAAQSAAAALRLSATIAEMSALRDQHDQLQLRVGVGDGLVKSTVEAA